MCYRLLQKETKWAQQKAFKEVKSLLTSDCLLVHYDPAKELTLACDASHYGLGAVLSHCDTDGKEKPLHSLPDHLELPKRITRSSRKKDWPCVCCQAIPSIFVRSTFSNFVRPQASPASIQGDQCYSTHGLGSHPALGPPVRRLRLLNVLQAWRAACKC